MESLSKLPVPDTPLTRSPTFILPLSTTTPSFSINNTNKSYKHQYANIYFVRLRILRALIEENARKRWKEIAGDPVFVPRVLEVLKGQLCYIIGTVYMDMPLKPNVLDDIARDHSIPGPPPRQKYCSPEDSTMLEDESGRIRLVGECLRSARLVTGVIMGALGIETNNGDFEVVDICFAGMAPQPNAALANIKDEENMDVDDAAGLSGSDEWIALVSGFDVGAPSPSDAQLQLLSEYLAGEAGGFEEQVHVSRISRLIIAGNSLAPVVADEEAEKKPNIHEHIQRRYGYDNTSFTPHPTRNLSSYLTDMARSLPVHLLAGPSDPSGTILPQQPLPRAMFGGTSSYSSFSTETNPTYIHIGASSSDAEPSTGKASSSKTSSHASNMPERIVLVHSGQPVDDMFRYLPSPPTTRLGIVESTLRWRHLAPTAPDTLWCHPYFTMDPFVLQETPDIYVVGNQPEFKTKLVVEQPKGEEGEKRCRIVLVPGFRESGTLVLVNLRTLAVRTVSFAVEGMTGGEVEA
ncbi:hypothetical protein EW026_g6796 [Hermanssonia centrifuga]|uniref:DNA-directed DNA polymerase n=1 Tax=Hermanssonia centrifuga TaxID=98765 RepID=A0A4S4KE87_9APHY|nr:hypothetical protein EW026_g6796 [Hermanssonia centrifuga]